MKKTLALKILTIFMLVTLLVVPGMALADEADSGPGTGMPEANGTMPDAVQTDTGGESVASSAQEAFVDAAIEQTVAIIGTIAVTAITVAGTWLTIQFGKSKKLQNIQQATWNAIQLAQQTVPELQADLVDDLKKANQDGKLTNEEVAMITEKLLEKTKQKMSAAAYNVLTAAAVDVNALIIGAGKEAVERMKPAKPAA